jgi:uncharacterized membrane protein YciS (DUF1049 family)
MLRNALVILLIFSLLLITIVFSASNPGLVELDLAFRSVELQKSLAFILAFGFGWGFGVLCAIFLLIKAMNERRKLRKALRLAEAEVRTLRNMPLQDAD